jgi:hypothetical protein
MQDVTKAAWIVGGALVLGAVVLLGGLTWVIRSAAAEVTASVASASQQITGQMDSLSQQVSQPIERMFHDPVPIRASEPVPVTPTTAVTVTLPRPVTVSPGQAPLPITISQPVVVRGRHGEQNAVPVQTDVNLLGGNGEGGGDSSNTAEDSQDR